MPASHINIFGRYRKPNGNYKGYARQFKKHIYCDGGISSKWMEFYINNYRVPIPYRKIIRHDKVLRLLIPREKRI